MVKHTLESIQNNSAFDQFWQSITEKAKLVNQAFPGERYHDVMNMVKWQQSSLSTLSIILEQFTLRLLIF